ncbi:MAG: PAS domain S-box protein [Planctomycetes bacterium]|nr:PAS domain S-box protein [Planctomycetota bacterium]
MEDQNQVSKDLLDELNALRATVAELKQAEEDKRRLVVRLAAKEEILEALATGQPLSVLLDRLARTVEWQADGMHCSILLLSPDGRRLRLGAAPSLPDEYNRAIDGIEIGPCAGSCGTAAYLKCRVIVSDIAHDLRWAQYRDLALSHGLRACWSVPLVSRGGSVLGTLSLYYRQPRRPTGNDLQLIENYGYLAQVIVEFRQAENDLRTTKARLESIVETAPDGIISIDGRQQIILFNQGAEAIFGYSSSDVEGKSIELLLPQRFVESHRRHIDSFGTSLEKNRLMAARREVVGRRSDGTEFPAEIGISKSFVNDSVIMTAIVRDVSARKQAEEALRSTEEQLLQAQKMEAFGQLAGGVAHDFNNLLTIVIGLCDVALEQVQRENPLYPMISEIKNAADRATALTRQLLAFSRRQVLQPHVLDLNRVIADFEKMLRRMIGEDVELRTVLASNLARVRLDPGQIEQVLMNLVVNARDAMPQGGVVVFETFNLTIDSKGHPLFPEAQPGQYVILKVTDTGCGMSDATKARIFEPFFTTKGPGKGTGLGLSTVYGIVQQSGGRLHVDSELGRGTQFSLLFPAVDAPSESPPAQARSSAADRGTETILVVEDEDAVRQLACRALQSKGYRVLEAACGREAGKVADEYQGPIDLLVTDVVMPQMSGVQVAQMLSRSHPQIQVLYLSGYLDDAVLRHGIEQGQVSFLQKPFSLEAFVSKVREILDQARA